MSRTCDVLVIGGGVAGVAAAVAAAREGAKTVLIEKETYLGGTGYAGMFQYIGGLYVNSETAPSETLNSGFVREAVDELGRLSQKSRIKKIGQVYVLPYSRDDLDKVLSSSCRNEKRLVVLLGTAATGTETKNNSVSTVFISGPEGTEAVAPKVVIDCSGSGNVAAMTGAEFELASPDKRQLAGFTVKVEGIRGEVETLAIKVPYHLTKAVQEGKFVSSARFTTFNAGDGADEGYLKMSMDQEAGPISIENARKMAGDVLAYLASAIPEFHDAKIAETSPVVLEREGRRIIGDYMLAEEDVLSAKKFSDSVVKNAWPIELWDKTKGTVYQYVPKGDYYEIPFRCLKARSMTNLLMAGRCISVSHEALGSTRVMGTCMALGEAAGKAAAYFVKTGKYRDFKKG